MSFVGLGGKMYEAMVPRRGPHDGLGRTGGLLKSER